MPPKLYESHQNSADFPGFPFHQAPRGAETWGIAQLLCQGLVFLGQHTCDMAIQLRSVCSASISRGSGCTVLREGRGATRAGCTHVVHEELPQAAAWEMCNQSNYQVLRYRSVFYFLPWKGFAEFLLWIKASWNGLIKQKMVQNLFNFSKGKQIYFTSTQTKFSCSATELKNIVCSEIF